MNQLSGELGRGASPEEEECTDGRDLGEDEEEKEETVGEGCSRSS